MTTKEILDFYYKGFAIIQGDNACVVGNYNFQFPNGQKINGNVSEHWTVKNEKLQSLRIYFDTLTFANNTK